MEERVFVVQERLGPEERKELYYFFPKGTMIWPGRSGRGVLTEDLQARKDEGREVEGYQAWVAEDEIHLYLGRHWQLSAGTRFGAPVKSSRRRKI